MPQLLRQNKYVQNNTSFNRWCCFPIIFFFLCVSFFSSQLSAASTQENTISLVDYLTQEKSHLTSVINEVKKNIDPKDEQDYHLKLNQVSSTLTLNSAKIQSLEGFLVTQNKQQIHLNQQLKHLQQLPLTEIGGIPIQERVAKVEKLLTINKKTIELITDNISLAQQIQVELKDELEQLALWYKNFQLEQKLIVIKNKKAELNKEVKELYQQDIYSKQSKKTADGIGNETNLLLNNQHVALIHQAINTLNLQKNVIKAQILVLKNTDTKTLQFLTDTYRDTINQYTNIENSLTSLLIFLKSEASLVENSKLNKSVNALMSTVKSELTELINQKQILLKDLINYQAQLKRLISARQSLAEYSIDSWPIIFNKISLIPSLFYKYLKNLTLKVYDSYLWLDFVPASILWLVLALIISTFYFTNRFLKKIAFDKERSSLTGYLYDGALTLVQRNIPYLCVVLVLWTIFYLTNISFSNYQLLFNLIAVWFTFRILILIARLVLLERISDSSGKDVKLYYRLKWLLLFGGWATALMTFGHLLPLSLLLQDLFNRLFMLFILTVSLVAWKSKDVIPYLIRPLLIKKKRYFKNAISLLVILVPITLFTTAIIGLFGFINLAWTMSRYQVYLLTVLVAYVLARGLLFDVLEFFSEWMISSLRNGWLWIEVFLKPIDKILRILLFLISVIFLFELFGWHSDSLVMVSLAKFSQYTIINLTGIHITVESTIEFFIVLAVFVWASKWTREFCFRWLYKDAKDPGIRNSFSVFTQYAVILLGSFITLRVLGLDFSGMSMILGGLAVGMGFGLRDFASNIVGGIMLLIERPVREGDLISIGEYEGQVSHIGIRSMRVSSWDNTEVLIPNAETFNKPFTNWTHQDGIVRTVVPIKVSRADDPVMIQQLILDVLAIIPEIVSEPPAQVFLKKIDQALIEFEARYFINVHLHTRFEVRSKVLFAITAQFKAAGVKPPIEPITIELKDGQSELYPKKQSAED